MPTRRFANRLHWTPPIELFGAYSLSALLLAVISLAIATLLRVGVGWLGVSLLWATYFPAVFIVALLAGIPAAVTVIVASVLIVLCVFMPPDHALWAMTRTDVADLFIFILSSCVVVLFSECYREALRELRARDQERDLLMKELEHRGHNTYAVVDAILRTSLTHDRKTADTISARIRAVSAENDLINWSQTDTVQIKALLSLNFAYNAQSQWSMSGPDIELSPETARMLGLLFHELITNAMKYGSLSIPSGRVTVDWQSDGRKVNLLWIEQGGPPVAPDRKTGFGSLVISQCLKTLSGDVSYRFNPDGLICNIGFKLNS